MANPFLVLGGVAVGVITAGIGVLQVPGWIDSANDSAVRNDLSQVALASEAAYTMVGEYVAYGDLKDGEVGTGAAAVKTGVKIQESSGVKVAHVVNGDGDKWGAIGVSKSGHVFARTSASTEVFTSDEKDFDLAIADIEAKIVAKYGPTAGASADAEIAGLTLGGTALEPSIEF